MIPSPENLARARAIDFDRELHAAALADALDVEDARHGRARVARLARAVRAALRSGGAARAGR